MSYSQDFRQRLMEQKKKEGLTFEETSKRFGVGIATLFRWQRKMELCKTRNKPATKIDMKQLKKDIEKNPDSFLYERAKRFKVGVSTVFYAIKRLGISYKKNSQSSQGGRSGTYTIPEENDSIRVD